MKGFEDIEGPSERDLAEIEEEQTEEAANANTPDALDTPIDWEQLLTSQGLGVIDLDDPTCHPEWDTDDEFNLDDIDASPTDAERRASLHETARDMSRIDYDTHWAFLSKQGSFLQPKEAREAEKKR